MKTKYGSMTFYAPKWIHSSLSSLFQALKAQFKTLWSWRKSFHWFSHAFGQTPDDLDNCANEQAVTPCMRLFTKEMEQVKILI